MDILIPVLSGIRFKDDEGRGGAVEGTRLASTGADEGGKARNAKFEGGTTVPYIDIIHQSYSIIFSPL